MFEEKNVVYMAVNNINNKVYIGITTKSLHARMMKHKRDSKNGSDFLFHRAIRKYGWDNFEWKIVYKAVDSSELRDREVYYIKKYKSYALYKNSNGYNMTLGGEGNNITDEMLLLLGYKPFYVYNLNGEFVGEYINKAKCSEELGLGAGYQNISRCLSLGYRLNGFVFIEKSGFRKKKLEMLINKNSAYTSESDVRMIKTMIMNGISDKDIAKEFDIHHMTVGQIRRGETHADVIVDGFNPIINGNKRMTPLSDEVILGIKHDLYAKEMTQKEIADKYNVSKSTVSNIKAGRKGSHVEFNPNKLEPLTIS